MSGFLFPLLLHLHSLKSKVIADSILRSAFPGGCFFDRQQGTALKYDGEHFREICGTMCTTDTKTLFLFKEKRQKAGA